MGQPELNHKIEAPDMEQLLQRVSLRYHVRSLSKEEIIQYIDYRLNVAGINKNLFSSDIYDYLYEYTGGIPRLINTICDAALTCAYADNKKIVNLDIFKNAVNELQWKTYAETHKAVSKNKDKDHLYETNGHNKSHDDNDGIRPTYSMISSRALVEITKQLKRIADSLEDIKK